MNAIKIQNLTKKYNTVLAVDDISLNVDEGDFFGFIGPNGAGKTTTIKTILTLLKPTKGSIYVLEKDVKCGDFLDQIGYVPGEANLYENLDVKDQINYFSKYYKNIDAKYINQLKNMFEVNDNAKIGTLSLGNKKKIAIICALMSQPKLLIFDEVSSGLDPNMQKVLFDELARLNNLGVTIFFSSHNLEEVQTYCKNVAIINKGKIIAKDNVSQLIQRVGVQVKMISQTMINQSNLAAIRKHISNFNKREDGLITFTYLGNINDLVSYASHINLKYFRIEDTKLEDIFTKYYGNKQ